MTVGLMGAIFYIGSVLTNSPQSTTAPIAPRTTKAQSIDYTKVIALNTAQSGRTGAIDTFSSNKANSPTVTPTSVETNVPTQTSTQTDSSTPTPTETILAYQTVTGTVIPVASSTPRPTVATLPRAGAVTSSIILFGVAGVTIFLSLLF